MPEKVRHPIVSPVGAVFDTAEVAEVLKVSRRAVQRMIRDGKLRSHKVGRSYRVLGRDLERFFAEQDVTTGEDVACVHSQKSPQRGATAEGCDRCQP
jgi:excisionase family DNA binding protein